MRTNRQIFNLITKNCLAIIVRLCFIDKEKYVSIAQFTCEKELKYDCFTFVCNKV